jgi:hypothetical protein
MSFLRRKRFNAEIVEDQQSQVRQLRLHCERGGVDRTNGGSARNVCSPPAAGGLAASLSDPAFSHTD